MAPAMLEDPSAPPIPTPSSPSFPPSINPRIVTLRDRITTATLLPISYSTQVPPSLLSYLCSQFNLEIEKGDTYPMTTPFSVADFGRYWFQAFGAIMILGELQQQGGAGTGGGVDELLWKVEEEQGAGGWGRRCLGTFYIKPNYPGRSSHICNGGFIVTDAARNRGVGRLMGEGYLEWAPKLGYTYSVFNLVYETNTPSIRIWDSLGFKRIGRIKGAGNLRSHSSASSPSSTYVDAIIYGRDLGPEGEDFVSEERFEKIRYYLKTGRYPQGADRLEKSRLRSAAMHYRLVPAVVEGEQHYSAEEQHDRHQVEGGERLMLKDKEVVGDPQRQYSIARTLHINQAHAGINKTTASIAERYHWVRIKETVSLVIKNCGECTKDFALPSSRAAASTSAPILNKSSTNITPPSSGSSGRGGRTASNEMSSGTELPLSGVGTNIIPTTPRRDVDPNSMIERLVDFNHISSPPHDDHDHHQSIPSSPSSSTPPSPPTKLESESHQGTTPMAHMQIHHAHLSHLRHQQQQQQQQQQHHHHHHHQHHHHQHHHHQEEEVNFPLDPAILHPGNSQSTSPPPTGRFHSPSPTPIILRTTTTAAAAAAATATETETATATVATAGTAAARDEVEEVNFPSDEDMLQHQSHQTEFIHLHHHHPPSSTNIHKFSHHDDIDDAMDTDDSTTTNTTSIATTITLTDPNTTNNELRTDEIRGVSEYLA